MDRVLSGERDKSRHKQLRECLKKLFRITYSPSTVVNSITVKTPIKRPFYFHSLDEMSLSYENSHSDTFCYIFAYLVYFYHTLGYSGMLDVEIL